MWLTDLSETFLLIVLSTSARYLSLPLGMRMAWPARTASHSHSVNPSYSEPVRRSNFTSIIFLRYFNVNSRLVSLKLIKLILLFKQRSPSLNVLMNCYAFLPRIPIKILKYFGTLKRLLPFLLKHLFCIRAHLLLPY